MHNAYIGGRSENNIKCIMQTILGRRTEQLDIIAGFLPRGFIIHEYMTFFMSDFVSFIDVEHIQFFHEAVQL